MLQTKKRKKKDYLLLIDYECLTREEILAEISDMRKKMKSIFKNHIGKDNAITPVELFYQVYGINPTHLDIFKKNYWWNVLKKVLSGMRKDDTLFVINKGTRLFVLQTQEEANIFKTKVDRDIQNLKISKKKADEWVRKKKWKFLFNERGFK